MKQTDMKTALMQSEEFRKAYTELKEMVREGKYWYIDSLECYPDIVPVILHEEYKVKYGELWLVFAEIMFPENFPSADSHGFVVAQEVSENE